MTLRTLLAAGAATFAFTTSVAAQQAGPADPATAQARAAATVEQMTAAEKIVLTHSSIALPFPGIQLPAGSIPGAGFVQGIERLGIPNLTETDGGLGIAWIGGARRDGATALPSGMALGASWNPVLLRESGVMIGSEARAKGFNVLLAGGANLIREPRSGRTFEYLSEDPLLSGELVGASIAGVQSNHVLSTIKHFALNNQETARKVNDVKISDAAARESELLAFQIGIERGRPGAVLCSYNLVNGKPACASDYLLNQVLKRDWRYPGFVMSDWGAVPGVEAAVAGLDQQSGAQLDKAVWFDRPLAEAAARDPKVAARVDDMATRIVRSLYAVGVEAPRPEKTPVDLAAHAAVAERAAREGIVLLRNSRDALPLAAGARKIVVIGGYADTGVLSGGGSSQVQGEGGPAATIPYGGAGPVASLFNEAYHRSVPLDAIKARAKGAEVVFRTGSYITDAVTAARSADVVILFATQWMTEGLDVPDLSLPKGQDALIEAVAAANPRTIVVLETGGPVVMPWLDKTAAVLEAWYPGARGGEAIAQILFGEANPSGRLPVTFPASVDQLPRPRLDGADTVEPEFFGTNGGRIVPIDYDIEGSDVGYRWFTRTAAKPLFPFGFGLSYTRFERDSLRVASRKGSLVAHARLRNVGERQGADVAQVYLTEAGGQPTRRLVGFLKVDLKPGESREVEIPLEPRVIARWSGKDWAIKGGTYRFALGADADSLGAPVAVTLPARRLKP
jgi:beta-glucosidase